MASKWDDVGLELDIQPYVLDNIRANGSNVETLCKNMISRWLGKTEGTGKQQRTWESVLEAVEKAVGSEVCETIKQSIVQGEF